MARDEKLILRILKYLKNKDTIDSYRLDIEDYDMNTIVEQLEFCHQEGFISVTNKLLGIEDEPIAMEGIKITPLGISKAESI